MPYIVQDLLTDALLEINKISPSDTMSATQATLAMRRANLWLDSQNADLMKVWAEVPYVFPLSSQQSYKMGADQTLPDFAMPRPSKVSKVNLLLNNNGGNSPSRTPIKILNYEQWGSLSVPNVQAGYPIYCYCDNVDLLSAGGVPYSNISFWTDPGSNQSVEILTWNQAAQFTALNNVLTYPNGWARFVLLGLAIEIAPTFGCEPSPTTMQNFWKAEALVNGLNAPSPLAGCAAGYPGAVNLPDFNIYSGDTGGGSWPPSF